MQIETQLDATANTEQENSHVEQTSDDDDRDEWADIFELDNGKRSTADNRKADQEENSGETKKANEQCNTS